MEQMISRKMRFGARFSFFLSFSFFSLLLRINNVCLLKDMYIFCWQLQRWTKFAESFSKDSGAQLKALAELNEELITKSVLLGKGFKPSVADVYVFATAHPSVVCVLH